MTLSKIVKLIRTYDCEIDVNVLYIYLFNDSNDLFTPNSRSYLQTVYAARDTKTE